MNTIRSWAATALSIGAIAVGSVLCLVPDRDPAPKSVLLAKLAKWGVFGAVLLLVVLTSACGPTEIPAEHYAAVTR